MADFVQVMKDWRRLCETIQSENQEKQQSSWCKGCPMQGTCIIDTNIKDSTDNVFTIIGEQIQTWAEENPEPIYQTWREYLQEQGVLDVEYISAASSTTSTSKSYVQTVKTLAPFYRSIPADIAQKLGLKPKEI